MFQPSRTAACLALAGFIVMLSGCGTLLRNPVPPELTAKATIPEMPEVRAWAGQVSPAMERDFERSFEQESPADFPAFAYGVVRYAHLALSGGGANGAFGAGFLNGWSTTGGRPVFKIVTGVSTGALMAPFAFLGPSYDSALHEFYTTTTTWRYSLLDRRKSLVPSFGGLVEIAPSGTGRGRQSSRCFASASYRL
jgi:Patatin-like phospholipase